MTAQELETLFDITFDRVSSGAAPGYTQAEKSVLLNIAQENLIVQRYRGSDSSEGFEQSEKRIQDLGNLVRYKTYTTFQTGFLPNSYTVILPNTLIDLQGNPQTTNPAGPTNFDDVFWFDIYETCLINKTNCSTGNSKKQFVREINHTELDTMLDDYWNSPIEDRWIFRNRYEGRKLALITDGTYQPTSYTIGYIRKPVPVNLSLAPANSQVFPDVSDELQREIVQLAVQQAVKSIGDSRLEPYTQLLKQTE